MSRLPSQVPAVAESARAIAQQTLARAARVIAAVLALMSPTFEKQQTGMQAFDNTRDAQRRTWQSAPNSTES
jgi:hypothetical protein